MLLLQVLALLQVLLRQLGQAAVDLHLLLLCILLVQVGHLLGLPLLQHLLDDVLGLLRSVLADRVHHGFLLGILHGSALRVRQLLLLFQLLLRRLRLLLVCQGALSGLPPLLEFLLQHLLLLALLVVLALQQLLQLLLVRLQQLLRRLRRHVAAGC